MQAFSPALSRARADEMLGDRSGRAEFRHTISEEEEKLSKNKI